MTKQNQVRMVLKEAHNLPDDQIKITKGGRQELYVAIGDHVVIERSGAGFWNATCPDEISSAVSSHL